MKTDFIRHKKKHKKASNRFPGTNTGKEEQAAEMQPVFLCYSQDFTNEDEVKEWIIKNALGTRNLTELQFTELIGRLQNMRKTKRGAQAGNKNASKQKSKNATFVSNDTAEQVAKEIGVNRSTVFHAANFVDGLDAAEAVVPGFKDAVLTGEVKAQKQEVAAMRKQTPDEIKNNSRLFLFLAFLRVFLRFSALSVTLPISDTTTSTPHYYAVIIPHAPTAQSPCGVNTGQRDGAPSVHRADSLTRSTTPAICAPDQHGGKIRGSSAGAAHRYHRQGGIILATPPLFHKQFLPTIKRFILDFQCLA